jgi:hypothetical protein
MQDIPQPALLDPDRVLLEDRNDLSAEEHASRAALLDKALQESCSYAQQLWQNLDAVREYLLDSLPPNPRTAGPAPRRSASPTGPDDEEGWQRWSAAYAAVTSVLAGAHGDSGFGMDEARREARDRRVMAEQDVAHDLQPVADPEPAGETSAARRPAHAAGSRSPVRVVARMVIVLLAVRGLRRSSG